MEIHAVLLLIILSISSSWAEQVETNEVLSTTTMTAPLPPDIGEQEQLSNCVNELGYKLLTKMMKLNENKNIVISPTGIAALLAMTLLGSVGSSYDELARALGFSQDILKNRKSHEQLGELLQLLRTNESSSSSRTLYADAIFVNERLHIREAYRDYLARVYRGDALSASFGDAARAKILINDWVANHTNSKIEEFLVEPLPVSTKAVLLNALYFSGQWAQPFVPEYTRKMSFKTPTGDVMAELMLNAGQFNYTFSLKDELHMIAFPYNDNRTTMYVLKPRIPNRLNLTTLLDRLDYAKINEIIATMTKTDTVIRFPRMELKTKSNLKESLQALGIKSIFDNSAANFALMIDGNRFVNKTEEEVISRINRGEVEERSLEEIVSGLPNPGVHVAEVLHDVKMTIDEYGTEAAAVTSALQARSSALFYTDSPFYMFIRNEDAKLVTFSAAIFDPTL